MNGRLGEVTSGAQAVLSDLYDAFGHRVVKNGLGGAATIDQYDETGHLLEEASGAGAAKIGWWLRSMSVNAWLEFSVPSDDPLAGRP